MSGVADAIPLPLLSSSLYLFVNTCEMRNPAENNNGEIAEENCLWTFAKRFTAELCFAGLFVLALVETVVRAIFAIPGYFIGLCSNPQIAKAIKFVTWEGAKFSLLTACGSANALVKNIYQEKIEDSIIPKQLGECLLGK